jgi:surface polysaccharide O-acyltransferase-like enzyme
MSGERSEFLRHVHSFRAFAIVAIVATHALYDLHWFEEEHLTRQIVVSVVQNGTVPFVFVAGFLFQHLLGRFRYKTYLFTKLRFVVLPYILVSLPYIALQKMHHFGMFADRFPRRFENDASHVAFAFLSGAQMPIPLWFVPMICIYYVAAPLFALIDRHPRAYLLLPPLWLLASFAHRPEAQTMLDQTVVYFLPVYLAGMFTSHFRDTVFGWVRRSRWPLIAIAVACVVVEVALRERTGAIESHSMFSTERGVFDVNLTMKLASSLVLLEWLRSAPAGLHGLLRVPAEQSFGIFFVHFYFIHFASDVREALGGAPWAGGVLNLALYTAALSALSMAVVWVIQRIFGEGSRYVVGC